METLAHLEPSLGPWARDAGARLVVVFGSAAKGHTGPLSDFDLAVDLGHPPAPRERLRLVGELQELAGDRSVDVVFLRRDMDPVLRFEVFRAGRVLYEAEPGLMDDERARALFAYEDALPFRRRLRKMLRTMAEEGTLVP